MDIFFLALLAFYIFFKLSKHLGKIDEEEKKRLEERMQLVQAAQDKIQDIIKQQEKIIGSASTSEDQSKYLANLKPEDKNVLDNILSRCNINLSFFLSGAKSAFEMVLKSFSSGDLENLKMLLSDKLYQGFEKAVNQKKMEEKTLTTNLIAIEKSEIISASLVGDIACVVVRFVSKQINYISSKSGEIIEGKKDEIVETTDVWTFKKDVTSPNPNWMISQTGI